MMQVNQTNCAIILAAGEGKRMKSNHPKVLSKVLFKPMLRWVMDAVQKAGLQEMCVVSGYRHEEVDGYLAAVAREVPSLQIQTALQTERKGTAHAVMMAEPFLEAHRGGNVLILSGDAPFLSSEIIREALELHEAGSNAVTVISAVLEHPFGYGRIVRDPKTGLLDSIVEEKDASAETKRICEVNSGAYWFSIDALLSVLHSITNDNAQGEYYLPDAIKLLLKQGSVVDACKTTDANAVLGANDCLQLNQLNGLARSRILDRCMENGTEIPCRDGVMIGPDVQIGAHVCILPSTILTGNTVLGEGCVVGPNTMLEDVTVGDGVQVSFVQAKGTALEADPTPFTTIGEKNLS